MKHLFLVITIFVTAVCGCAQNNSQVESFPKTMFNDEVLNGKIRTIREKHIYKNATDSFAYNFNELGMLISEESTLFAGLNKKAIYSYNSENNINRLTMYDKDGNETDYIEYFYETGKLIKRFYKHAPSTPKITRYFDYALNLYKYDDKGNLIESKSSHKLKKSRREVLDEHIKYTYDSIGNCIMEEKLDRKGIVVERINNKYINHQLIETNTWQKFEGEDLYLKDIYEYNEDSTLKSHEYIVYKYGSATMLADSWTEDYSYKYEYDENGKVIGETITILLNNEPHKSESWKYVDFDKNSNWIKKEVNKAIYTREIEYY